MPDQPVERKLAAIFAADIVGYSRLMSRDEIGTLGRLKSLRTVVDAIIASHRGRIFTTAGDSVVADFASAVEAVNCALAVQEATAAGDPAGDNGEPMRLRIGVHLGDVIVDGNNLLGDGVNIAARLETLAAPGTICVSRVVRDQVEGRLDCGFDDLGEQSLKNIERPVRAYRVGPRASGPPAGETPALPAASPTLPLPDKPSIAVLPFANLSDDPEQEYFADGMVEDITTALSKLRWFFVVARNSAFTYKGRAVDVKQVGRELGVRYVLEGSVRRGGDRLRITAQLVDAASGNHVWAERYDRDLADIFAVQDEITERVVAAIEPELYAAEHIRSQRKPPDSLDAWECVIRALSCIGQGTREANTEAEALCRRAIAITPSYGQAHSLLAWTLMRGVFWSGDLRAVLSEIAAASDLALKIDDRDPWAHCVLGILLFRRRRFEESQRAMRRALELNPNFALAHAFLGQPLIQQGYHEEAIRSAEQALRLSPQDRLVGSYAARTTALAHLAARRYPECIAWARTNIEKAPEELPGYLFLTAALAMQGDMAAAAEARDTVLRLWPKFSLGWSRENTPIAGEIAERVYKALSKAGLPD
jgi:adenylate cyclase